jgi:hypothetical protein
MVDNGNPIAQPLGLVHVMRGQNDCSATALQILDDIPKLPSRLRIQSRRRLIQKNEIRIADERYRDSQTLPLTSGKVPHPRSGLLTEGDQVQRVAGAQTGTVEAPEECQDLQTAQLFMEARLLERHPHTLTDCIVLALSPPCPKEFDSPRRRFQETFEDLDGGRLAGAVRPQQPKTFTGLNGQVQSVDRIDRLAPGPVALRKFLTKNCEFHGSSNEYSKFRYDSDMGRFLGTVSLLILVSFARLLANPPASSSPKDHLLSKDWPRTLERKGFRLQLDYAADLFSIVSGGLRHRTDYVHNVDVILRIDGERALGWEGMTFQVYVLNIEGRNPSDDAGDAQGLSNIAAPPALRLYEIWLAQSLWHDRLSLLAGLYDLNTEFDVIESANVFLNSSHGIDPTFSQSGLNGPSIFPYTTLAVRARIRPTRWSYLQSAIVNGLAGDPDDPRGTHVILSGKNGILSTTEAGYVFHSEHAVSPKLQRRLRRRVIMSPGPAV